MVARELIARLARLAFPLHRCKRSNRVFTQRQHLALLVLRQLLGKSYREFCAIIELCTPVLRAVGLRRVVSLAYDFYCQIHKAIYTSALMTMK